MNHKAQNVSESITTPRLLLRPPQQADVHAVNEAIIESFVSLHAWMAWATHEPTHKETEQAIELLQEKYRLRQELSFFIFDKNTHQFLGAASIKNINWQVSTCEIGYWVRSSRAGQGIITESTNALVQYAYQHLHMVRIAITCDEDNTASRKIAHKLGFTQEDIVRNDTKWADGSVRTTVIYARYDDEGLPKLEVHW